MRVLVVYCHPVEESFCAALREAAVGTLEGRGDEVRLIDLYAEKFDPVMGREERLAYHEGPPKDPALAAHIDALNWAAAIIFIYPTWWYGLPAMLKGWLDRVWAMGVVFDLAPNGGIVSRVRHIRKIGVVTTCGATRLLSFVMGQPGRKMILRGIRSLCALRTRTLYLAHYDMDNATPESRAAFLAKVRSRLKRF
ncbi:NAD(P)H-dependent oxidoreductase [Pseudaminobacter sp. 19-2017]|uniref:NAD(P)H-dependent oxidoreductase n=1 Tax=Pseudaminobacter soli (ex Zhang et al. 2022) TaxID=2831468 RepID=A0A942I433_9HYPH|nr:NAD(P)H-dependent oxidoreductase [Pseudaminobacter soli]MBS3651288.1 NAD(P)H-dependent oxidoreductase [Pseudaminobacter soli]